MNTEEQYEEDVELAWAFGFVSAGLATANVSRPVASRLPALDATLLNRAADGLPPLCAEDFVFPV